MSHRHEIARNAADHHWVVTEPFSDMLVASKGHVSLYLHFHHRDHSILTASKQLYEYPSREDRGTPVYRRQFVHSNNADGLALVNAELQGHFPERSEQEMAVVAARKARIIEGLQDALDERFEDGTSVLEYVLLTDPALKARLSAALEAALGRAAHSRPSERLVITDVRR